MPPSQEPSVFYELSRWLCKHARAENSRIVFTRFDASSGYGARFHVECGEDLNQSADFFVSFDDLLDDMRASACLSRRFL